MAIWTYWEGKWHDTPPAVANPMTHAMWLGSCVFDGARAFEDTAPDLGQTITQKLAGSYLRNPHVSVNVIQYASHRVTVEGAVEKRGVYEFKPGERLSSAIALAGGPSRVSRNEQVAVFRRLESGLAVAKFNYDAIQQGTMIDPVLLPGDRVVVGVDGLEQFWQDMLKSLPVFALFTRI